MRISFTSKYRYGDEVVLRTEPEVKRIVVKFLLQKGNVTYGLANRDNEETWHQEVEIQPVRGITKIKGFK
jgi:hypothetical protein